MRLKARQDVEYAGKMFQAGMLFDAPRTTALQMINQDQAEPFGMEDPSTRSLGDAIENLLPPFPDVPGVSIMPVGVIAPKNGSSGSITVTITSPGVSGTWTVDKDSTADWLTYSPMTPQSSDGTVSYTVAANSGAERTAHLYINGKTFTVDQKSGLPA
jgi:Putative binding domain, N-terminal